MTYRYHGLLSMLWFTIAVLLAMWVIWTTEQSWPLWAVAGYAVLNIFSALGIAFFYCAKCTCRGHCSHFIMGWLASRMPRRAQGPYGAGDYLGMLFSAGVVFLYPLPWLIQHPYWLLAFLAVGGLGAVEILLAVCPSCTNTRCPAARWRHRIPRKDAPPPAEREA